MSGFRKLLVFIFALCSAYFAFLAFKQKEVVDEPDNSLQSANWSVEEFAKARRAGKLIFFKLSTFQNPVRSPEANEILKRHYALLELDPVAFPADYKAIRRIFERTNANGDLNIGVFSPRGYPIFLASKFSEDPKSGMSECLALLGAANVFKLHADDFRQVTREVMLLENEKMRFPFDARLFFNTKNAGELTRLKIFFSNSQSKFLPATLSENARLIARIAMEKPNRYSLEVAVLAFEKIKSALNSTNSQLEKLLYIRALSEFAFIDKYDVFKAEFLRRADSLLSLQQDDSLFYSKINGNTVALTSENALALIILSRAFMISGDERFSIASRSLSAKMDMLVRTSNSIPAILSVKDGVRAESEADGFGASILARSFLDAYFAFNDELCRERAAYYFHKFDSLYCDDDAVGWYANSNVSVFAESFRYRDRFDDFAPSAIGEGAQMLSDIYAVRQGFPSRLISILSPLVNTLSVQNLDRASLKLATIANPMRERFLQKHIKEKSGNQPVDFFIDVKLN